MSEKCKKRGERRTVNEPTKPRVPRDPRTFLVELKRRRVGRVLVLYAATSFAVVEAADIVLGALSQPDWMLQALLALVALGLPVALVLAWTFDLDVEQGSVGVSRADGTELGHPSAASGPDSSATGDFPSASTHRWVSPATLIAATVLIIFGVAAGSILGPLIGGGTGVARQSIAVLPLQNLSPDPDDQ